MGRTTRRLALAAALALVPGRAAAQAPLELEVIDLAGVASALPQVQAAANVLLEPASARLETRLVDHEVAIENARPRAILLGSPAPAGASPRLLLAVARHDVAPATIWIYVPSVLRAAGLPAAAETLDLAQRRELGIALGRILVHEILHLLAPERPHTATGLMAARLGRTQLVEAAPRLDDGSRELLARAGGRLGAAVVASAARGTATLGAAEDWADVAAAPFGRERLRATKP
ncbi:MAG: hypothetical protein AB7O37_01445 [Vicinamibacteria bacterium]